jgi:hypothetical protein
MDNLTVLEISVIFEREVCKCSWDIAAVCNRSKFETRCTYCHAESRIVGDGVDGVHKQEVCTYFTVATWWQFQ